MYFYHRTPAGQAIVRSGFRNAAGYYMTSKLWRGVWVANMPLTENEGAKGNDLILIEAPIAEFRRYEWVQEGLGYREFLVPAKVLNRYQRRLMSSAEEDRRESRINARRRRDPQFIEKLEQAHRHAMEMIRRDQA